MMSLLNKFPAVLNEPWIAVLLIFAIIEILLHWQAKKTSSSVHVKKGKKEISVEGPAWLIALFAIFINIRKNWKG